VRNQERKVSEPQNQRPGGLDKQNDIEFVCICAAEPCRLCLSVRTNNRTPWYAARCSLHTPGLFYVPAKETRLFYSGLLDEAESTKSCGFYSGLLD
jgi:hypothetical protein